MDETFQNWIEASILAATRTRFTSHGFFFSYFLGRIKHSVTVRCMIDVLLCFQRGKMDHLILGCPSKVQYLAGLASPSTGPYPY
jgi:hypothetical protein